MKCPKCENSDFRPIESKEGVNLDFCSACKGLWFDPGELAFYLETSEDLPTKRADISVTGKTDFSCPKCTNTMLVEMPYSDRANLLIDLCMSCHGIWLDHKELPKIEELARSIEPLKKIGRTISKLQSDGYEVLGTSTRKQ